MTLRELMLERIYYCVTTAELLEFFETTEEEILMLPDDEFLELYEDVSTFSEWDPRQTTMTLN